MNPPSPLPSGAPNWRSGVFALLLIAGLSTAFVTLSRRQSDKARTAPVGPTQPAEITGPQILAGLPSATAASFYGKVLATAVEQVQRLPQSAEGWISLGDVLAQGQRDTADTAYYDHAEKAYQYALKLNPKSGDAMSGLAWVHGGRHQFDLSILWAEKALALAPDHIAATGILGDAAVEKGDYDKAFDYYQKMMDLRPDLSSLSRGAHLLWLTGQQNRATMLMEQAIRSGAPFAENTAWCRARLAMMYFHDGMLPSAIGALQPVLNSTTVNPHVLLAAGRIAAAAGDYPAAIAHYQKANISNPSLEALAALGDIQAVQGNGAAAEEFYIKVEALHHQHRETGIHDHMEMARFYADHDRNVGEALRLAIEHGETGNPFEADTFAWLYYKNGDQPKAIGWIKKALKTGLPDASIHYHAACIATAAGDRVSAGKHLQQAVSKNPHFNLLLAKDAFQRLNDIGKVIPPSPEAPVTAPPAPAAPPLTQLR